MNKKILVCDDDQGILEMLELILEDHYQVILEPNSIGALKKINSEAPDLVLLDIWMPVISGDQVLAQLRANPQTARIPVLMYSASTDGAQIASASGADGFLAKPFDVIQLLEKVAVLLEPQQTSA